MIHKWWLLYFLILIKGILKKITVPCISFTDIIQQNNFTNVDLLKLDCEGCEYDKIYNTEKGLIKKIKMMIAEVHDWDTNLNNIKTSSTYLKFLGFSIHL